MDVCQTMPLKTKFLRLRQPVRLGTRIDGWRVCWLGGWDRRRLFFVVMIEKVAGGDRRAPQR